MMFNHPLTSVPQSGDAERQLIRVEFPPRQAGIAAALRRAFTAPLECDRDEDGFDALLAQLH